MVFSVRHALVLSLLALAPALVAQAPRIPRGIYAVVNAEGFITQQQQANPSITTAQLDVYFDSLYQALLSNPAVSGLTLQVHWDGSTPILRRRLIRTSGVLWTTPSIRLRRGTPESGAGSEDHPAHRDSGLQFARMGVESDSELRRAVSIAGSDPSEHVWNGDLHGLQEATTAPCFRCRGTPLTRAPGKPS